MKNKSSILRNLSRIIKRETIIFAKKHWFKVFLIFVILHFVGNKKVDFAISMSTRTVLASNEGIKSKKPNLSEKRISSPKPAKNVFGLGNLSFSSKTLKDVETKSKSPSKSEKSNPITETFQSQEPDHSSILTFVFNNDPSGEYSIHSPLVNQQRNTCKQYIKRFAPVAVVEMKKYGIPASIKLAQALLASEAGQNDLSKQSNNHFGVKCFSSNCKKGHCRNFRSDTHKDFFKNYENAWTSFRKHSLLLQNERYMHLQEIPLRDYQSWAHGLEEAGYAEDEYYAEKLIRIIEYFDLSGLDIEN